MLFLLPSLQAALFISGPLASIAALEAVLPASGNSQISPVFLLPIVSSALSCMT